MKTINFTDLQIENFKSFRKERFALGEYGTGVHFLCGENQVEPDLGSNGSGKSSLFDAICWCFYGKTPRGLRNPDVAPWKGKKGTTVTVQVEVEGKSCFIQRNTNPNRLLLDGVLADQSQIDKLLMTYDIFTNTVLLGQNRPLFLDLDPRRKMELFGEVLDLDRWDARAKKASEQASLLIINQHDREKKKLQLEVSEKQLGLTISELQTRSEVWLKERKSRVKDGENKLTSLRAELEEAGKRKDRADLALDSAETELRPLRKQVAELKLARQQVQDYLRIASTKGGKCPTCGQPIKAPALTKKDLQTQYDELTTQYQNLLTAQTQLEKNADNAAAELRLLVPTTSRLQAEIKMYEYEVEKDQTESNPYTVQITQMRREQYRLQDEIEQVRKKLVLLKRKLERTLFWVRGFKDVRLYVIEEVLQELEVVTNSMLSEVGLEDWVIRYSIEKETKSGTVQRGLVTTIFSPDNDQPVRWESWSGGEGQRLRLIGAFALSEVLLGQAGVSPTMEILDEPTQALSPEGISDLLQYLYQRVKLTRKSIWFTDQHAIESGRFRTITKVVKDKNGSHIEKLMG